MVFAVQAFRERLGIRTRDRHSAARAVLTMPNEKSGPIVRNRLGRYPGLAAKQVELSKIWSAEEPLCQRYFVRGQIAIVEQCLG